MSGTLTGNAMKEKIPVKMKPRIPNQFLPVKHANLHNLKDVSIEIPLNVLTVITGVAGSGKSTLIRDVFAKQYADRVVLVDQSPVTATGRSTPATFLGFFDEIRKLFAAESGQDASLFTFNGAGQINCSTVEKKFLRKGGFTRIRMGYYGKCSSFFDFFI